MNPLAVFDSLDVLPFVVLMLPLFGFVVLAVFGDGINRDREQKGGMILACAVVLLSFAIAVRVGFLMQDLPQKMEAQHQQIEKLLGHPFKAGPEYQPYQPMLFARPGTTPLHLIEVGDLRVPFALLLDPLTLVLMLVVTGIGSLIHIYSVGYMSHDPERVRYFSYLNLFTFFMLVLIMGGNLPLMFIGWEGVGLCSYLLIGFWFKKKSASDAGKKAFIVNRIGDAGLILAMALAFKAFGTLDLLSLVNVAQNLPQEAFGQWGTVTAVCLLLFVGACGKSAQIPLHVWLPDAMEGPTPVSALIHAATMVTAGVYMVSRLGPLYQLSETAMTVVAVVGTTTAIVAATIALVQTDIKKVLAYSTVSQLGYMFLACGVGAFGVAVFHLFTHAFFKALLFLGSGSVIHALSGEQDMRQMGGLRRHTPWTFWTMLVGTLAIAGIFPFAGFFSKDAILAAAWEHHKPVLFGVALLTALLTSFYMWRMLCLTFFGTYRGTLSGSAHAQEPAAAHADAHADGHAADHAADHGHGDAGHGGHGGIHESPWSMLLPLVLLAVGSAAVGFIHVPEIVGPAIRVEAHHGAHAQWLPILATISAILGIFSAWYFYLVRPDLPGTVGAQLAPLRRVFEAKWGFDDAYNWFARRVIVEGSEDVLWKGIDASLIDAAVNGAGSVTARIAQASRAVQTGLVRSYVLLILGGAVIVLSYLLWLPR
jgi:NADH-quinone oxidoreductase subunit L